MINLVQKLQGDETKGYQCANCQYEITIAEDAAECIQDLLSLAVQYRDDLKRPPTGDSLERRVERINDVLSKWSKQESSDDR